MQDVRRDPLVPGRVLGVKKEVDQVEPGEEGRRDTNVDGERFLGVVLALGVGAGQDRAPGPELAHKTWTKN